MSGELSLLDAMAIQAGCEYLSDLHNLNSFQQKRLVRELERLTARDEDLFQWNDAVRYLTGVDAPCPSAEQAKAALLAALTAKAPTGPP